MRVLGGGKYAKRGKNEMKVYDTSVNQSINDTNHKITDYRVKKSRKMLTYLIHK